MGTEAIDKWVVDRLASTAIGYAGNALNNNLLQPYLGEITNSKDLLEWNKGKYDKLKDGTECAATNQVGTHLGTGGPASDPNIWREREQTIKNHTPLKNDNQDATEEYYKQAKDLLTKEGGWSSYMDADIAKAMIT